MQRFQEKEDDYIPDNYLFYTNVVLTPAKDTGVKDKIETYVKEHNDIIKHFYVKGYDEICAMLDNNRDVAISYAATILPGDLLMEMVKEYNLDYLDVLKKYLLCEFEEEMYPRLEQAGSVADRKIPIEKVCVDINVINEIQGNQGKFAQMVFALGNEILGYKKVDGNDELERNENFILVGGPGKGKSTISQFIAQIYRAYSLQALEYHSQDLDKFIKGFKESYGYRIDRIRIPFKVALREYAAWIKRKGEENHSVICYISERIEKFEGNKLKISMLRKMFREQAWVFFFDGLDEVPESSNRQEVLKQISRFIMIELKEEKCDCMIIGTTREQGYSNDFGRDKYLHMRVAELSKDDSRIYINKLFEVMEEQTERREEYIRIMNEALEDETTGRLMKTPLQVTIIAILVKSGGKPPHERYSLFRQYYDTMVKREKQKGIVATLNDNMGWLEEIHYLVGNRLQSESEKEENASAEISREELEKEIRCYVEKNRDDFYETKDGNKETEFLMTITERICFLSENREGFYSFTIRSMQEYFAGTYLIKDRSDEIALYNIEAIAYKSYWRNVLLFALGYIELERKSLESDVGLLCERMNGKDNIVRDDYNSDNLCLFGSWLAIDILSENIFRGKPQNKYVVLAAKAIELDECINYNKFSLITGAQKDKLVCYVREHCEESAEKVVKAVKLYLKLHENEKNNLSNEIAHAMETLTKEQALMVDIEIVKTKMKFDEMVNKAVHRIKAALEKGKIKQFLPWQVLSAILQSIDKTASLELRKNMLLQCLYSKDRRIEFPDLKTQLGLQGNVEEMFRCLSSVRWRAYRNSEIIKLTESIKIILNSRGTDKAALQEIQTMLQRMHLDFLAELCEFLLNSTWIQYQKLFRLLDREEKYLAEKYQEVLKSYVGHEKIDDEKKFLQWKIEWEKDYASFLQGDFDRLCLKGTDISFNYSCGHQWNMFADLMHSEKIPFDKLSMMNDKFFDLYLFAAGVQADIIKTGNVIDEKMADGLISVIQEAIRRKKYYRENFLITLLITSKFKGNLWNRVPDFTVIDEMLQREILTETYKKKRIKKEILATCISNIISKLICDAKESGYLSIIPTLINEPFDIRKCISENDVNELERIEYSISANILTVKLLRMCISENEISRNILEDLLKCTVPRPIIYLELEKMLRYCIIKNREKLWVEMCLRLEKENFERSLQIRNRIIDDMMEAKCNAARWEEMEVAF